MSGYNLELHVLRVYFRQLALLACELRLDEAKQLIIKAGKDSDLSMDSIFVLDAFWDGLHDYEDVSVFYPQKLSK